MSRIVSNLNQAWKFAIDPKEIGENEKWYRTGLPEYEEVEIPHTFNADPKTVNYRGSAWYEYSFTPEKSWEGKRIRIKFNGVYRDADIWLNGEFLGQHYNSGFTTFIIDTNGKIKPGAENHLIIKVQNNYSVKALPYEKSFDWADDGGIFREVSFIITGQFSFDHVKISATPVITSYGNRVTQADAVFKAEALLTQAEVENVSKSCRIEIYEGIENDKKLIYKSDVIKLDDSSSLNLSEINLSNVSLWHFDFPKLYTAVMTLKLKNTISDKVSITFGFREFLTENHRFILNGEYVRLCGTEWMPGSNPLFGNAEPKEYLYKFLKQLKESNCVFTRFHWQQDDAVYDWCDRNGMLVQEEIPHWGKVDEMPGKHQMEVSKKQIDEMIASHYNHPSIIMWGMGNELYGQAPEMHAFVSELKEYIRNKDIKRQINYITNTMFIDASKDATRIGDVLMVNEYIGTWHGNLNEVEELKKIVKTNPNRPIVISEFGLCEPTHTGGDKRRSKLFTEKMNIYSKFPEISGIINFCLNDYRTQMGEEGKYQFRRRVHGSTDIFGEPKPSYYVVQDYCSPIGVNNLHFDNNKASMYLSVKDALPSYLVDQYQIIFLNKTVIIEKRTIPTLKPGEGWDVQIEASVDQIQILRPNGFIVRELNFI